MGKQVVPGAKRGQVFYVDPLIEGPGDYPYRVVIIGLDTEHKRGEHHLWDARASQIGLDEPLVKNIRAYGVREAVKVQKIKTGPTEDDYIFEVVDGRQRTKMCREAAKRARAAGELPPLLKLEVGKDREEQQVGVMISLNAHRFEDDTMTRARQASDLLGLGYTRADLAVMYGVSKQAIANWCALTALHKTVQKAIEKGKISASAASQLADVPIAEQPEKLEEMIAAGATGVAEAKRQRTARKKGKPNNGAQHGKRPPIKMLRRIADNDDFLSTLSPDARDLFHWMMGDEKRAQRIKGLTGLLKSED